MLKIGNITLDVPFFQAPLSGYSDYAMRKLARDYGVPFTFAGVMLAKSVIHPKILKKASFQPKDDEHPIGAQILGRTPATMAKAAKALAETGYDLIDINLACPAPKVLRRGRGGSLINEPDLAIEIYRRVREAVTCPVTVKIRTGFDDSQQSKDNFQKITSTLSEDGIDAIVIHGRNVLQKFTGTSDWKIPAELKKRFPRTTIFGSGDLLDAQKAAKMLKDSGVDGVAIARGAVGNPWIFRELRAILEGRQPSAPPDMKEQGQVVLEHFELVSQLYGEKKSVRYMRKFLARYCKLHPQRRKAQQSLLAANDREELLSAIKQWYEIT
jgi:tRNA-dihydrouridine synthase B